MENGSDILFSTEFNFWVSSITFLVDTDVFFPSGSLLLAAWTVGFPGGDVELFPGESSIFPSDARGLLSGVRFYLCKGGRRLLCGILGVTPVRRREDTDGDGDSGVKVQIDQTRGVSNSRVTFRQSRVRDFLGKKEEGEGEGDGGGVRRMESMHTRLGTGQQVVWGGRSSFQCGMN